MHLSSNQRRLILALTFATGAAGLTYQVVWQRYLARLLGNDRLGTAVVLAVFLAGLSLGYMTWGRRSEHDRRLLRTYGLLECAIGVWALAFPWLFRAIDSLTASWRLDPPWGLTLGGGFCAVLLIGVPTFCMGGTVPILTRALTSGIEGATGVHSRVYAINTAGAVCGALATGFGLIHRLGLQGTLLLAAALNLVAGAYMLQLARGRQIADARASERSDDAGRLGWRLASIALLSGLYFMSFESIWIRLLQLSIGASSFDFALVVGAVVLAIAIGAWLAGRRAARSSAALMKNQLAAGAALLLLFVSLDLWPWTAFRLRILFPSNDVGFGLFHATIFLTLLVVLGVPAALMGATLPLAFDAAKKQIGNVGRQAGRLLAWNALGSLIGGLVGGHLILTRLNLGEAYLVALLAVIISAWIAATPLSRRRTVFVAVGTLVFAATAIWFPYDPLRFAVGTFRLRESIEQERPGPTGFYESYYANRTILAYRDDPEGTFAVVENLTPEQLLTIRFPNLAAEHFKDGVPAPDTSNTPRSIVVNGKSDSSTYFDRETLRLSAHLPALFNGVPRRALVIGLGTGVTAGELTLYSNLEEVRVAEIAPAVADFLPFFDHATHGLRSDPRYTLITGDAFRVLRRSEARYDAIVSEPSNPWVLGVDQLFSREFYALVSARLADDGVFVQWIQRYATTPEIYNTVVRTLRSEFPYLRAFRGAEHDDLFIASLNPLDDSRFERMNDLLAANPAVRASLAQIELSGRDDLLQRELQIPQTDRDGTLETLDHPRIHQLSGRAFFRGERLGDPPRP